MSHEHPQVGAPPIVPVTGLRGALDRYAALGCQVTTQDEGYGSVARDPDGSLLRFGSPLPSPR
jgi:hypothetical protein